jgi:hypothetical protein
MTTFTMVYQHPGRVSPAGPKGQKTSSSEVDNKSIFGREKEKQFFKNERTIRECHLKQRTAVENLAAKRECV